MSSGIQGPGGAGGPTGPGGPGGPAGVDGVDDVGDVGDAGDVRDVAGARTDAARGAGAAGGADPVVALAADLDAGRITPEQALARLLDDGLAGDVDPAQRAELEALFADLLANDPYLAGLARDVGAAPVDPGDGAPVGRPGGGGDDR